EQETQAPAERGESPNRKVAGAKPEHWSPRPLQRGGAVALKRYTEPVATRKAYGEALAALGAVRGDVVVLDAEVSNSTYAEDFKQTAADRFFEMYIAEKPMIAAGVGMQVRKLAQYAETLADFLIHDCA